MSRWRVLLADDHALVRAGIRSLLNALPQVDVVGEAGSGDEALALTRNLHPDVLLLDISMAGMSGLEALAALRAEESTTRIIILSMHAEQEYVAQALRVGAEGYLLKDAAPAELEIALRAVMRNETYLSPAVSRQVVAGFRQGLTAPSSPLDALTPRQQQILKLIAEGKSTKEIAFDLELSVKTVETHRAQLMERLQIRDVPGLTRYAIRIGLIQP